MAFEHFDMPGESCRALVGTDAASILLFSLHGVALAVASDEEGSGAPAPEDSAAAGSGGAPSAGGHEPPSVRGSDGGAPGEEEEVAHVVLPTPADNGRINCDVVGEYHRGTVTGAKPHVDGAHVVTCGADGSVRVWDCATGALAGKCHVSGGQTCLAAAPNRALVAVGSDAGVLRLVSVGDVSEPMVVYRGRMGTAAVQHVCFNADTTRVAAATADLRVYFLTITPNGEDRVVVEVQGFVQLPEAATSMAWPRCGDGETAVDSLLLTLLSPGVIGLEPPEADPKSGGSEYAPEEVAFKIARLELTALRIVGAPSDNMGRYRFGMLYALCADRCVHKFHLPDDASNWAGLKGRTTKSAVKVAAHQKPPTALSVCANAQLVVLGASDGAVSIRYSSLTGTESAPLTLAHDLESGGASQISFDACGRHVLSGGADGSVFVFATPGTAHIVAPPAALAPLAMADADADDVHGEPTALEAAAKGKYDTAQRASEAARAKVADRLARLKEQLVACMQQNAEAPELERIEGREFLIHTGLVSNLKSDGERRYQALKAAQMADNARAEIVAQRLRASCWEAMATKGSLLGGMRSSLEVWNFALPPQDEARFRHVALLRRVEKQLHRALGVRDGEFTFRAKADEAGNPLPPDAGAPIAGDDEEGEHPAAGAEGAADLLYSEFDVTVPSRKITQLQLLQRRIYELKAAFNEEFARLKKQKSSDTDKMGDLNLKATEVLREAKRLGSALTDDRFAPRFGPHEDMDSVLTVKDGELKAEKYVSPEERAALAARNNVYERALKHMMNGTLESKRDDDGAAAPQRADWMSGDPKKFTPEQNKEWKEFQGREKAYLEDRAKRRGILEAEVRTLRAGVDEFASKFDEALLALARRSRPAG